MVPLLSPSCPPPPCLPVSVFPQVRNKDQKSGDYSEMEQAYRPSHADATYDFKYGIRAVRAQGSRARGWPLAGLLAHVAGNL